MSTRRTCCATGSGLNLVHWSSASPLTSAAEPIPRAPSRSPSRVVVEWRRGRTRPPPPTGRRKRSQPCRTQQLSDLGSLRGVNVSQAFVDPDGDALKYAAASSAPHVVTARASGAFVTLAATGVGTATIHVTATDPPV